MYYFPLLLVFFVAFVTNSYHVNATNTDQCLPNSPRFNADVWQAEQLSRYSSHVDANSGLATDFCKHSIDYSDVLSGGPPPDGIPPIDKPSFESIAAADQWLVAGQPVIALTLGGESRAYPLAILTRHEIANDVIDGVPVAVTFCPLCNAAMVFDRRVGERVLRFGVSGNLRNSDLIMWDAQTLSWWQQFTGEAIVGELTGMELNLLPSQLVAWDDFKQAYPQGQVLSRQGRRYGDNPYVGYDSSSQPFLFTGELDQRLPATERVLGYFSAQDAIAFPLTTLAKQQVVQTQVGERNAVVLYSAGQLSALDQRDIATSREVGSAAMFYTELGGQQLRFIAQDGQFVDEQTGSTWNVFGRATAGKLKGQSLTKVMPSGVHFWFAWAAFRPNTAVYEPS